MGSVEEIAQAFDSFSSVRYFEFLVARQFGEGRVRFVAEEERIVAEAAGAARGVEYCAEGVRLEGDFGAFEGGAGGGCGAWGVVFVVELRGIAQLWRIADGEQIGVFDDDEA